MTNLKNLEKIFKGLANRRRLHVIQFLLRKKEASVSDIAEEIRLSFKSTSKHLRVLRQLDILDNRQEQLRVFYRVSSSLFPLIRDVIKYIPYSRD